MTLLFKRSARVVVDRLELTLDPDDPTSALDVAFSVERSLKPEPNTAEIKIWNLNPDNRSALEELDGVGVSIEAGYKQRTALLFSGTMRQVFTSREGPDLVTNLASGDGEKQYQQSRINLSIAAGTPNDSVVNQAVAKLGVGEGNVASVAPQLATLPRLYPQGGVLSGSAAQILQRVLQSLGYEWSIQDGAVQILRAGDVVAGTAVFLSPDTGLVGSPSVDNKGVLSAQCLLIPDIFPGRIIQLVSERLEGSYRVQKCNYSGETFGSTWYIDIEAKKL